jgi:hypothetical protein
MFDLYCEGLVITFVGKDHMKSSSQSKLGFESLFRIHVTIFSIFFIEILKLQFYFAKNTISVIKKYDLRVFLFL